MNTMTPTLYAWVTPQEFEALTQTGPGALVPTTGQLGLVWLTPSAMTLAPTRADGIVPVAVSTLGTVEKWTKVSDTFEFNDWAWMELDGGSAADSWFVSRVPVRAELG